MRGGVFLASVFLVSCKESGQEEVHYIRLDCTSWSFSGSGNAPFEIRVETSPADWTVESAASWLDAVRSEDGRTLTLTAQDNLSGSERSTAVALSAGNARQEIQIRQFPEDTGFPRYRQMIDLYEGWGVMSPSGRYLGGMVATYEGEDYVETYHPLVIDMYTNETFYYGTFPATVLWLYQPFAVGDDGTLFIQETEEYTTIAFKMDGSYATVPAPEGMRMATVQGVSADGRYWVGFGQDSETQMYYPLLWEDGVPRKLLLPDENYRGEPFKVGVMARGISADGSVIYGNTWDDNDMGMVYWTDKNGKPEYVGKDVHDVRTVVVETDEGPVEWHLADGMRCSAELTKISNSGRWIAGTFRAEEMGANGEEHPAFYNTETETTVIVEDYGASVGVHVTDDGLAFIAIGTMLQSSGAVYDLNTRTHLGSTQEWVLDNYGIIVPAGYVNYANQQRDVLLGSFAMEIEGLGIKIKPFIIAPPLNS